LWTETVEAACCSGGECPRGLPRACSFDCGVVYSSFMADCNSTIRNVFPRRSVAEYEAFDSECSRMDAMSMVRAIDSAVCSTCGDNITTVGEECDWGTGNSLSGASCRYAHSQSDVGCDILGSICDRL
jgi:hypothetical protein